MTSLLLATLAPTTTLQDGGRVGHGRHGVPRSGPVDRLAHRLAALLAGHAPAAVGEVVAIEVGPHPQVVEAADGRCHLAVGGEGTVEIDGVAVPMPCVVAVDPGSECRIRPVTWAYAVPDGSIRVDAVLGSRSHHPRSGLGPGLADGARLDLGPARRVRAGRYARPRFAPGPLILMPGPQHHLFHEQALAALVDEGAYATSSAFDRMAHRLDGPTLRLAGGHDIVSDGIVPGSLQVPGDGRVWVLTADHQPTGGYPRPAVLGTVALARFVRLPPGTPLWFAWGDVAGARADLHAALDEVARCAAAPVAPTDAALGTANLVTGVVHAGDEDPS